MAQESLGVAAAEPFKPQLFIVSMGAEAKAAAMTLAGLLRKAGVSVIAEVEDKSMKAQMRSANRFGAEYAVIIGENELKNNCCVLKNMADSSQHEFVLDADCPAKIKELIICK